jgi:hypothetical protein
VGDIAENFDLAVDKTVNEITDKYVKRTNYILFSNFTIKAPFTKTVNIIGVAGYYFDLDDL